MRRDNASAASVLDVPIRAVMASAYRYLLWRTWDASASRLLWVVLSPSTVDEQDDDPTLRRGIVSALT
jgi:hypothetical protein